MPNTPEGVEKIKRDSYGVPWRKHIAPTYAKPEKNAPGLKNIPENLPELVNSGGFADPIDIRKIIDKFLANTQKNFPKRKSRKIPTG